MNHTLFSLRTLAGLAIVASTALVSCNNSADHADDVTPMDSSMTANTDMDGTATPMTYDRMKMDPAAPTHEIKLEANGNTMAEMSYSQNEIRVPAGHTIKLTFKNNAKEGSAMVHNWVLCTEGTMQKVAENGMTHADNSYVDPNDKNVLFNTLIIKEGAESSVSFPAPEKGTYSFVCTTPGHWSKMNGTFIVE